MIFDDLEWLARNKHTWPEHQEWCWVTVDYLNERRVITFCQLGLPENEAPIYKKQWQTRRAELQCKPSWNDAPEWAEWLAQDGEGEWVWYKSEPSITKDFPNMFGGNLCNGNGLCYQSATQGTVLGDWRDTLEQRPKSPMLYTQQIGRIKRAEQWRGQDDGLPPENTECEVDFGTGYEWCRVVAHRGSGTWIVTRSEDIVIRNDICSFRPMQILPTEEDLVVEEIFQIIYERDDYRDAADALYRAGYRKLDTPTSND